MGLWIELRCTVCWRDSLVFFFGVRRDFCPSCFRTLCYASVLGNSMETEDDRLPANVMHFAQSPHLHILRCSCGAEVEFNPKRTGAFEHALQRIRRHACPLE
jgi:hypothetical protein